MSDADDETGLQDPAVRVAAAFRQTSRQSLRPGLHLVATPIGNLADITLRALAVLTRASVVYCEDTRHTRKLLSHYGIRARTKPYHEHNSEEERPRILAALAAGETLALVSDAGTPLISDPGYKLVREALAAGYHVESLPGACAPIVALTSSGMASDAFFFAGFLPAKSAARRSRIAELKSVPGTLIFFEAPPRVADALDDLASVLGARHGVVLRELTKRHEERVAGPLTELVVRFQSADARGEFVIVVEAPPASTSRASDDVIRNELSRALDVMSLRDAAKFVADKLDVPKGRAYDLGLVVARDRKE